MTTPTRQDRPAAPHGTGFWAFLEYPVFWVPVTLATILGSIALFIWVLVRLAMDTTSTGGTSRTRRAWAKRDARNKTCTRCGTWAQQRPHPYAQQWFTEWRLPDGTYQDNLNGGKTPPCQPPGETAPRAGKE